MTTLALIVLALVTGLNLLLLWSLRRLVRAYRNECRAAIAQRDGARARLEALEAQHPLKRVAKIRIPRKG